MDARKIAPGLMLAMPQLEDPNFERSVVLMVEHNEEGSFGLIVNRPNSDLLVADVLSQLGIEWGSDPDEVVWNGGPVMPGTGWVLHEPLDLSIEEGKVDIVPGIVLSTSPNRLRAIAEAPPPRLRFVLGFSGWGPAQLESELAAGAWITAEVTPELIFDTPADAMWETVLRSLGIDPASLVSASGVH
jgi:putative transcriptional regulator